MSQEQWSAVDAYIESTLARSDDALEATLAASEDAALPAIQVSPAQGRFLEATARLVKANAILEIGTLGGYSTIWMARALPTDGQLVTLEASEKHANVARDNIARAGLMDRVEIRIGDALDSLRSLASEGHGPFDLIFIDADKANNAEYFDWALQFSRSGSAIVVDNVVRGGEIANSNSDDPGVKGTRAMFDRIANESRVTATVLQTVGSKGWDGFLLAVVNR